MKTVKVIEPAGCDCPGMVHSIPEADLQGFLDNGWATEGGAKSYADMSAKELKAELEKRGLEAEGNKGDMIASLELNDESSK